MNKKLLMEMEKEQLADYVNLLMDTVMDLEDRLQEMYEYVNNMSYETIVDNPKKDLVKILKRVDKE